MELWTWLPPTVLLGIIAWLINYIVKMLENEFKRINGRLNKQDGKIDYLRSRINEIRTNVSGQKGDQKKDAKKRG